MVTNAYSSLVLILSLYYMLELVNEQTIYYFGEGQTTTNPNDRRSSRTYFENELESRFLHMILGSWCTTT